MLWLPLMYAAGTLDSLEWMLGALLLLVPYAALGYQNLMLSQGRFAAVAFPVYIVLGRLAVRAPAVVFACLFGISGFLLGTYAALFAAYYRYF